MCVKSCPGKVSGVQGLAGEGGKGGLQLSHLASPINSMAVQSLTTWPSHPPGPPLSRKRVFKEGEPQAGAPSQPE